MKKISTLEKFFIQMNEMMDEAVRIVMACGIKCYRFASENPPRGVIWGCFHSVFW